MFTLSSQKPSIPFFATSPRTISIVNHDGNIVAMVPRYVSQDEETKEESNAYDLECLQRATIIMDSMNLAVSTMPLINDALETMQTITGEEK